MGGWVREAQSSLCNSEVRRLILFLGIGKVLKEIVNFYLSLEG